MSKMKNSLFALVLCSLLFGSRVCMADDADIFVPAVTPDLLLLLDLSGSMNSTPAGGTLYASSCSSGLINSNSIDGPYYNAATENYTVA